MGTSGSGRVIVFGSVNVDLVMRLPRLPAPGETVLGGVVERHHGGKGANQAVAAARAGARVHLVGAVGAADGDEAVGSLAAEGVQVDQVLRVAAPTGLAAVLVDAASGENQIAVASGANALVTAEQVTASLAALQLTAADIVVLSFELPAGPLLAAARQAAAGGARVLVNPAPALPGYAGVLPGAIATPNVHELRALIVQLGLTWPTGQSTAPDLAELRAAAAALARYTGAPVVVTVGADGALVASEDACDHVPGLKVEVVDTTGAGDTLTGVLAASLAAGLPLQASVRRAVAAGALAVTKAGARDGMPAIAAIDELVSRCADQPAGSFGPSRTSL